MFEFDAAAVSRTGPRPDNQDSALAGSRLIAVADGVGGNVGGAVASSLVASWLAPLGCGVGGLGGPDALARLVRRANARITAGCAVRPALRGMATTLVALTADETGVSLAHIGDSRGYLLRDGVLTQVTKDHSLVQALVDAGRLAPEDVSTHPQRSVVYAALHGGHDDTDGLDVSVLDVRGGDRLMVCSDGLSDVVPAAHLAAALVSAGSPEDACHSLLRAALDAPAHDNITIVVADVVEVPGAPGIRRPDPVLALETAPLDLSSLTTDTAPFAGPSTTRATVRTYGAAASAREDVTQVLETLWP
ncbi:SpoIIE family protein phosphatase [Modestobacter sp. I12A-02628]|uniref:Serine/threonine-protein phosphatase n=1 Tax=Goekera deserti TaxID=2497753 RepID=A0A7K3WFZ1_9ACTN|nr:protein phosphatase 2C domain-containing protein [Goekera deserti]MPR00381.1 SpoIIE family protein phosphatase [Goekera deserti]NDI50416.1 SpoIIE family protein phosphatase [Goekera deserti]NEL55317.1 serine/threonine-protein phosphatase [Goekera deserti]